MIFIIIDLFFFLTEFRRAASWLYLKFIMRWELTLKQQCFIHDI